MEITTTDQAQPKAVARSLDILVVLIKENLAQAKEAADRAAQPYHEAVAEKMVEARSQMSFSEFISWTNRHFGIKQSQATYYLSLGKTLANYSSGAEQGTAFTSIKDFRRSKGENFSTVARREWHEPVQETIQRAKQDAERIRDAQLTQARERSEERKLALRLIDIGYKVLAKELHPDKGGSRDDMSRLSRVRDRLKQHA